MAHSGKVLPFLAASFFTFVVVQATYCKGPRESSTAKYAAPLHLPELPYLPRAPKKHAVYVNQIENNYYGRHLTPVDFLSGLRKLGGESGESVEQGYGNYHDYTTSDYETTYKPDYTTSEGGTETTQDPGTTDESGTTHQNTDNTEATQDAGTTPGDSETTSADSETTSADSGTATSEASGTTTQSETSDSATTATPAGSETTSESTTSATGEGGNRNNRGLRFSQQSQRNVGQMQLHKHQPRSIEGRGRPGPSATERRVVYPVQQYIGNTVARPNRNIYQQRNNLAGASRSLNPIQSNRNVNYERPNRNIAPKQSSKNVNPMREYRNTAPSKHINTSPARLVRNSAPILSRDKTDRPMNRNFIPFRQQRNVVAVETADVRPGKIAQNRLSENVKPARQYRNTVPSNEHDRAAPLRTIRNPTPILKPNSSQTLTKLFSPQQSTRNISPPRTAVVPQKLPYRNINPLNSKPTVKRENKHAPSKSTDSDFLDIDRDEYMRILTTLLKEEPKSPEASAKRRRSVEALLNVLDQYFPRRDGAPAIMTTTEQLASCLTNLNKQFEAWLALLAPELSGTTTPSSDGLTGILIKDKEDFQKLYELFQKTLNASDGPERMQAEKRVSAMGSIIRLATRLLQRKQKELNDLGRPSPDVRRRNKNILDHLKAIINIANEYLAAEERDRRSRQASLFGVPQTSVDGGGGTWLFGNSPDFTPSIENILKTAETILGSDPRLVGFENILDNVWNLFNLIREQESNGPIPVVGATRWGTGAVETDVGRQREITITVSRNRGRDQRITIDELIRLLNRGRGVRVRFNNGRRQGSREEGRFDETELGGDYLVYYDDPFLPPDLTSANTTTTTTPR